MRFRLSNKETLVISIVFLALLIGIANFYLFFNSPLQKSLQNGESELRQEEALLSTVEASIRNKQDNAFRGTLELQKRLPVASLLEQFLLDLEMAEVVSGSFITSMSFGEKNDDELNDILGALQQQTQVVNSGNTEKSDENLTGNDQKPEGGIIPEDIKRVKVNLTVESPTYFELEAFLKTLEDLRRITKVDELSFSGNQEVVSPDTKTSNITYMLSVSTFYYPKLEELKNQLPQLEIPESGKKINPLLPMVPIGNNEDSFIEEDVIDSEKEDSSDKENNQENNLTIKKHRVGSGETLFSISQRYYNSRSGEKTIRDWNNLKSDTVFAGQMIEIPIAEN